MGLFKPDFYRFFTIGFAAGALLVLAMTEGHVGNELANRVVPVAEAHSAE